MELLVDDDSLHTLPEIIIWQWVKTPYAKIEQNSLVGDVHLPYLDDNWY